MASTTVKPALLLQGTLWRWTVSFHVPFPLLEKFPKLDKVAPFLSLRLRFKDIPESVGHILVHFFIHRRLPMPPSQRDMSPGEARVRVHNRYASLRLGQEARPSCPRAAG